MLRLEKRFKELEPLMQVHSFCSQVCVYYEFVTNIFI